MPSEIDLTKIPDFEAARTYLRDKEAGGINLRPIKTWIDKLEEWCRASWDARVKVEQEHDQKLAEMEVKLEEAQQGADQFEMLVERLEDHERGIVDIEEVYEACGLQVH